MATDYKFALDCIQESAGSENAKLKVYKSDGTTVVLNETEITSTDADNPTTVTFEVTGMDDPSSSEYQSLVLELTNEYYVDSSTDRNILLEGIRYCTKHSGTYKVNTRGEEVNASDSETDKWLPTQVTDISGDDQDNSAHSDGFTVTVWSSSKVTITFPTKHASNVQTGYPALNSFQTQS